VKDLSVHVHLKDSTIDKKTGKKMCVLFGEGEVGLLDQIKALKSNAYNGFISIETHFAAPPHKACFSSLKTEPQSLTPKCYLRTFFKRRKENVAHIHLYILGRKPWCTTTPFLDAKL